MIGMSSTGRVFGGITSYLMKGRSGNNPERVEWHAVRNLPTNDTTLTPSIMEHTANASTRCKKPVYHLSISLPPDEKLSDEALQKVAETTLADLGLEEHQVLMVAHNDTDQQHVHLLINRVHPETGKAWSTSQDRKRMMQSLRRQEKELGLREVPNRLTNDERELLPGQKTKGQTRKEYWLNQRNNQARLDEWSPGHVSGMKQRIADHLKEASSWDDLQDRLAFDGVELQPKGQGFIITDGRSFAKLSQFGKGAKKSTLEKQFNQSWKDYENEELTISPLELALERVEKFDADTRRLEAADKQTKGAKEMLHKIEAEGLYVQSEKNTQEKRVRETMEMVYRDPSRAEGYLKTLERDGVDLNEYQLDRAGKLQGFGFWGYASPARKQALKQADRMLEERDALRRLDKKLGELEREWTAQKAVELNKIRAQEELERDLGAQDAREEERQRLVNAVNVAEASIGQELEEAETRDIVGDELSEEELKLIARLRAIKDKERGDDGRGR